MLYDMLLPEMETWYVSSTFNIYPCRHQVNCGLLTTVPVHDIGYICHPAGIPVCHGYMCVWDPMYI